MAVLGDFLLAGYCIAGACMIFNAITRGLALPILVVVAIVAFWIWIFVAFGWVIGLLIVMITAPSACSK